MNYDNYLQKLKIWNGKRITEKQLRDLISLNDYEEYFYVVSKLDKYNHISPVKSSGPNGMYPPLYKRYTIIKEEAGINGFLPVIRLLNTNLNIEGYLTYPEKYLDHKPYLDILDAFFKSGIEKLSIPLSINERSFQIFHMEKALKEDKFLSEVLNFNRGIRETLNYYSTPEPFFIHNITRSQEILNILIIENKDTWFTLKSIMSSSRNKLVGTHIDILLYGEGKKITRRIDSLTEFDNSFFKGRITNYFYFGDLDYEGIGIYSDLLNVNPSLNIRLFAKLYSSMLEAAKDIQLPTAKEKQSRRILDEFICLFDNEQQTEIFKILQSGSYIPQEILNRSDFSLMINEEA